MNKSTISGVAFTFGLAAVSFILSLLPGLSVIGPLAVAILSAIIYRHFFGYPDAYKKGIQFSAKILLRTAIVLFGLKLNITIIFQEGLPLLAKDFIVILFSIGSMVLLARLFKAEKQLSFLLGIGTGICGASAIAAISPIVKGKEEETALSVAIISLVGTAFAIGYTLIRPFLHLDVTAYGTWAGLSLHEIGHVALAGNPAGEDGLGMALLAKLGRVFLLVPVSLFLVWLMSRKDKDAAKEIVFPWFLLGFIFMSLFGSFINGRYLEIPPDVLKGISTLTTFILTMAMAGLGLSVSLADLKTKAVKPMLLLFLTSILLSGLTYMML
ncbi:putative sulfate exporter family transporter [Halobacillus salinarum]|uniref:Sulfate exporter family transporter n=1 Tax=Halobacillus salinarum TaxID=2932257 RepID=A0ABY4EK35_9BACI|nr:putative sulfate exporter family transporter [Halobacillus salinarum]UOQ44461.1 putative sulfate exporter family transporter [Halobacillus salinarum]